MAPRVGFFNIFFFLSTLSSYNYVCLAEIDAPPENDRCVTAFELVPDVPIEGNNAASNFDFVNQGVCGARSDRRALWYSITGNGNLFTAHLCADEDEIVDFGVFNECNSQNCNGYPETATSNRSFQCKDDESQSYTWLAEEGSRYFIHVRGPDQGANFYLIVADQGTATNNICANAETLPLRDVVRSTTAGSTHDFYNPDFCGVLSNYAGVWYEIQGDGTLHTINICSFDDVPVDFGIFSECGNRSCLGYSETRLAKCGDNDVIEFSYQSEANVPYYVHVRGETDAKFALRVVGEITAPGDVCTAALEIAVGDSVDGDTTGSTFDFVDEFACGPKSDIPGVWYLLNGDGYRLTTSVCSKSGDKLYFSVFDDCGVDKCIGYHDVVVDAVCGKDDSVGFSFDTYMNDEYLIHVRSENDVEFILTVEQSAVSSAVTGLSLVATVLFSGMLVILQL